MGKQKNKLHFLQSPASGFSAFCPSGIYRKAGRRPGFQFCMSVSVRPDRPGPSGFSAVPSVPVFQKLVDKGEKVGGHLQLPTVSLSTCEIVLADIFAFLNLLKDKFVSTVCIAIFVKRNKTTQKTYYAC